MDQSILISTKKVLGLPADYEAFDQDILEQINSAFSTLNQLGLGPEDGFGIDDDKAVWSDYPVTEVQLRAVRTYVFLRVRYAFDPPTTSFVLEAMKEQIREHEWRLNVFREGQIKS